MNDKKTLEAMVEDIQQMRCIAERLEESGKDIVTVERNIARILSSIRLLEVNVTDIAKVF